MNEHLYEKEMKCPICSKSFKVTKVKAKGCKVASRDTDFCVYYEGLNPLFYDVWICENCGYAAQAEKFEGITGNDSRKIASTITPRWNKRSFNGERTVEQAIETFKLALINLQVRGAKSSEFAKVCVRIAWLYRAKKEEEKELEFLRYALKHYTDTYEKERFPVDKLDEFTCMYMIAELHRRVGNNEESIKWFSRLISSPDARKNGNLIEMARDQFQLVKENTGQS